MNRPTTIQEVLDQLDLIIADSVDSNDRLGLFAYVYRRTTAEILKEIQLENFEDNRRMEKMDVIFANLYLDAYNGNKNNKKISKSWEFAFVNKNKRLTILQHIMMGINAHINLDLAIATSSVMFGKELSDIEKDFNKVNDILFNITNEIQDKLSRVSRLLFLLDIIGKKSDEKVIDFSMRKAREQAWNSANLLWALEPDHQSDAIIEIDSVVLQLSNILASPKSRFIRFVLQAIQKFEEKDVGIIISKLTEEKITHNNK